MDETYVKVTGRWTYLYRAVDQHGQVIDVFFSTRRNAAAAREFFAGALRFGPSPVEVTTEQREALRPADAKDDREVSAFCADGVPGTVG